MSIKYVSYKKSDGIDKKSDGIEQHVPVPGNRFRLDTGFSYILGQVDKDSYILINLVSGNRYNGGGDLHKICRDLAEIFVLEMPDGSFKHCKFVPCKETTTPVQEVLVKSGLKATLKSGKEVMVVWIQKFWEYVLVDTTSGEIIHSGDANTICDYLNTNGNTK